MVEYLVCCCDTNLNGEPMTMKSLRKINTKLNFLYTQNEFLNPELYKLWCNSLVQSHFDYAFISFYPLVNQKRRRKVGVAEDYCICFCLVKLNSRQHIELKNLKKLFTNKKE